MTIARPLILRFSRIVVTVLLIAITWANLLLAPGSCTVSDELADNMKSLVERVFTPPSSESAATQPSTHTEKTQNAPGDSEDPDDSEDPHSSSGHTSPLPSNDSNPIPAADAASN